MNKTIVTSAGALLAAITLLSPAAEAGFKFHIGLGFPIGGYHPQYVPQRHWRERVYVLRKERRVHVAKKKSATTTAAVEEAAPAKDFAVENENSSISVAALPPTDPAANAAATDTSATPLQPVTPEKSASIAPTDPAPATTPVADQTTATPDLAGQKTAKKLDCKTFFPSVGLTLSVPCG